MKMTCKEGEMDFLFWKRKEEAERWRLGEKAGRKKGLYRKTLKKKIK